MVDNAHHRSCTKAYCKTSQELKDVDVPVQQVNIRYTVCTAISNNNMIEQSMTYLYDQNRDLYDKNRDDVTNKPQLFYVFLIKPKASNGDKILVLEKQNDILVP